MNNLIIMLIPLLITVESGGNSQAEGDGGRAIGILQIHKICIDDVNRIYKTKYLWPESAKDNKQAMEICRLYLQHYGKHYERTTGNKVTFEVLARIWNGGPKGYKKKTTLVYWGRVKNNL